MLKEERQTLTLNELRFSGRAVVGKLAVESNVFKNIIRRDLLDLDQKGQVKRVFGRAIPMECPVINFFNRKTTDAELKQHLALKASDFLKEDQLVTTDGSSTNLQFVENIPNGLKLTVLTNNYSIAHVCSMKDQVDMIILGGWLLKESVTNVRETAVSRAAPYRPDLCFMDVYTIHPEYGMAIPYPDEAGIKRQLVQSSRRVIALVNPTELNTVSRYHMCGIEAFTTLATDDDVPGGMAVNYRNKGPDFLQSEQVFHKTYCDFLRYFCGILLVLRRSSVCVLAKVAY